MPTVAGATAAVMFVFIAISFRSLLIALRAVLTVALTLSWAFGFVWLIYGVRAAFIATQHTSIRVALCACCICIVLFWVCIDIVCVCVLCSPTVPLRGWERPP